METSLYLPVKAFLEKAGYIVKGEVGGCDLVGLCDDDPPVVVVCELKMSFNLELILQAVDRAAIADEVWIAARVSARGKGREADRLYRDLCRRLGIGMLGISDAGDDKEVLKVGARQSVTMNLEDVRMKRELLNASKFLQINVGSEIEASFIDGATLQPAGDIAKRFTDIGGRELDPIFLQRLRQEP